jgi:hypothetical protein
MVFNLILTHQYYLHGEASESSLRKRSPLNLTTLSKLASLSTRRPIASFRFDLIKTTLKRQKRFQILAEAIKKLERRDEEVLG